MRAQDLTRLPEPARRLVARHPELLVATSITPDLVEPQRWGAVLSPPEDGISRYRYMLWRIFDDKLPMLVVIMLNPSTADHEQNDPTMDGLVRRARAHGWGGVLVVNCFAFRAREPADMRNAADPEGPANEAAVTLALEEEEVLCAWGTNARHKAQDERIKCLIAQGRATPMHLRLCKGGEPEHPLYVPCAIGPTPWSGMSAAASSTPTGNSTSC